MDAVVSISIPKYVHLVEEGMSFFLLTVRPCSEMRFF